MEVWLKSNLHLSLKKEKTKLTYAVGNKIGFLGFKLYQTSYNQLPYRNSRRIEKAKRVKNRVLAYKEQVKKKLKKQIRLNLVKNIKQKLKPKKKNSKTAKKVSSELSEALVDILGDNININSSYRQILRELEEKLADVILNDTNEKIRTVLTHLIKPEFLDPTKENNNIGEYSFQRDTTLISKTKLSEAEYARRFTDILCKEGYEHYKHKEVKKIRFHKDIIKYLRDNDIKLTYYPLKFILPNYIKDLLVLCSKDKPKKGAISNNYKVLINYL